MPKEDPFVNRAQLLKAIKKYPEIWDSNNKLHMCRSVTAPMWNEIAELFGNHVPTVKLQSIWSQMKYHYHNLVHRQILHKERFTTKWEHFEPMSFMYNITVAKIVGTTNADGSPDPTDSSSASSQSTAMAFETISSQPHAGKSKSSAKSSTSSGQGRGRPSGSFTWIAQTNAKKSDHITLPSGITAYSGFTGLVPPGAVTMEAYSLPVRKPGRPGRPGHLGANNISMRARIIDVIKDNPILWSGKPKDHRGGGQCRTSTVWKEVATQLGLTPSLVQTRWSIIKQRYVDELQKERRAHYTGHIFESSWEHFDRMSFMREILIKKVDEREHTREQIQEIVSEHQSLQHQGEHLRFHRNPTMNLTLNSAMTLGMPSTQINLCDDEPLRRRVKTESDLEWDPFDIIIQVNGADAQEN